MKIVGLGAGGHARAVVELFQMAGEHEIIGMLDPRRELWGTDLGGAPVLGGDDLLAGLKDKGAQAVFLGVGTRAETTERIRLHQFARDLGFRFVSAIHPTAFVSRSASVGEGVTIMPGAIVNAAATLGDNVIVNTAAVVEHHCQVGDHVHLATGVKLAGGVSIGAGSFVGINAAILPGVRVGERAVIGAGAVVTRDVIDNAVAVGNPARVLRTIQP